MINVRALLHVQDANGDWSPVRESVSVGKTATANGSGTGQISDNGSDQFVVVTCDDADKIITLPTPTPGNVVALYSAGTGYELSTNDPAVGINGGMDVDAESAIPADTLTVCICPVATNWLCSNTDSAGVVSATEVAAP